jgi:hypothetical protein
VRLFSKLDNHQVIVVADKKSKRSWDCDGAIYLSVKQQQQIGKHLKGKLPFNHYSRKMMGYLKAIQLGADVIIDLDDDNLPKPDWGFPALDGMFPFVPGEKGFINIYQYYTEKKIWPRGLPLRVINDRTGSVLANEKKQCKVGIWQSLADGQPDVDAIYRLTDDSPCTFLTQGAVVLGKKTISPFNSQNTLTRKSLFPLLYLPAYASFRFTDILRSLVAQPLMWMEGYHLGFYHATVVQKRNQHDYFEDFLSEIPMFRYVPEIVDIVSSAISPKMNIGDNLYRAYEALNKNKIIPSKELSVLEAWLKDLSETG